jgi:hypothetical protein
MRGEVSAAPPSEHWWQRNAARPAPHDKRLGPVCVHRRAARMHTPCTRRQRQGLSCWWRCPTAGTAPAAVDTDERR